MPPELRRLAWLNGAARTLMSSYRRGFEMFSEFVPSLDGKQPRLRFFSRRECARKTPGYRCRLGCILLTMPAISLPVTGLMGFPDHFEVDLDFGKIFD